MNLPETMRAFYDTLEAALSSRGLDAAARPGEGLRLDVPFACWTAVRST